MKRLETPIRTAKCLHIEAVDLKSLIHLLPFKDKVNLKQDSAACMQCPICRLSGPLLKDGIILKFLEDFKRCIVEIDRQGQAVEVEQCNDTIIDLTESFNSSCCLSYHYKHFHSSPSKILVAGIFSQNIYCNDLHQTRRQLSLFLSKRLMKIIVISLKK